MGLDLYRITLGLAIDNADGTAASVMLTGSGAPGGDAGDQDDAPIGSIFLRTDATASISAVYQKIASANALSDWVQSASKDYVDAAVAGLSWREPVLVLDATSYLDLAAAVTAANSGDTVDAVTIVDTDRLLFTNFGGVATIATQDETDFNGAGSNGTFAGGTGHNNSDVITMSDGSTITVDLVSGGVVTEFTVLTNSTDPFLTGATLTQSSTTGSGVSFAITTGTNNEVAFAVDNNNVYIVSGGTGNWTFTEDTNAATDGDALLVQEGTSADQQWIYDGNSWVQIAGAGSQLELGHIRDFIGKTGAGSETPTYSSAVVVAQNSNLETAIGALDAAIGNRTYTEDNFVTDGETLTASIDALDIAIAAINALVPSQTTGITSATTVDTVLVDEVQATKWFVTVFDEGDTDQKLAVEIFAANDGTASGDATFVDFNVVSKLKLNGNISGLDFDVVLNGTAGAQTMGLEVTSGDTVTVNATRIDVEI